MSNNTAFLGCICITSPAEQQQWVCGAKQLVLRTQYPHCVQLRALGPAVFQFSSVLPSETLPLYSGKWSPGRGDDQKIHIKYHSWPETLRRHTSTHCLGLTSFSHAPLLICPLYIVKSHLPSVMQKASLTAPLACPYLEEKVFFIPTYWRAACSKTGHYTGSLPIPMFAWHLRSRGSSTRQARCHQQMGHRYVANISVGSIPSLSIWMSVYPKVYLALLKRMLQTAANFFFFWTCVWSCFYLSHTKQAGFYLLMCSGFSCFLFFSFDFFWPLCVVSLSGVHLDLTNSMSRNSPALAIDHTVSHTKLTDENYWRWRGPLPAFVFWQVYSQNIPPSRRVCSLAIHSPATPDLTCLSSNRWLSLATCWHDK